MSSLLIDRPDGSQIRLHDHRDRLRRSGGPALVLSNSLATDVALWSSVIDRLAADHQVISYDTRGHGDSRSATDSASLPALADDLIAVMDAVGVQQAFVAGISLGGMTSLQCGLRHAERMLGLIPCNCRASIDAAGIAAWDQRLEVLRNDGMARLAELTLARWFDADFHASHPAEIEAVRAMIHRTSAIGFQACVRAIQSVALLDQLPSLRLPVLLVAGAQDSASAPPVMQAMAKAIPGARLEVLDPCGHLSSIQQPQALAQLIAGFIAANGSH